VQRAIVHNLPCFIIHFSQVDNLPSAAAASEAFCDHFDRQQPRLNEEFSVVRYAGHQLKVGVKNKADYHYLCDPNQWPTNIVNRDISVTIPKFTPEQFSLVVRFIPAEFTTEQVEKEVERSANSANNFREIVCSYPRATKDFRFAVTDIREYNGLLRLGHIGIGNMMRIVTPYRPANKLTYCTKCWLLGHTRNKCQQRVQKCRICLLEYDQNHNEVCSKQYQCAQCNHDHYSLDMECPAIQQYRGKLNQAVKQAVKEGTIKRITDEKDRVTPAGLPIRDVTSFPPLITSTAVNINLPPPRTMSQALSVNRSHQPDISNEQLYEKIRTHFDERAKQIDELVLKLEQKVKTNENVIAETRQSISVIVATLQSLTQEVIIPISRSINKSGGENSDKLDKISTIINEQISLLKSEILNENTQLKDKSDGIENA
jgi:hypothetical protein